MEDAETSRVIQFLMGLNDSFANVRGQILNMKPRPGLSEIYNMLDQEESQRMVGVASKMISHPAAFQVQDNGVSDSSHILLFQGGFKKPKCSHCLRIGHTVDRCYKVHGFPSGHPRAKPPQTVGSTNLATLNNLVNLNSLSP